MSIIFNMFLYLLLFILSIFFLLIIFPINYTFYGGYNNNIYGYGNITLLKFCKISILANANGTVSKLKLFGFPLNIDAKTNKKKSKDKGFEAKKPPKKKQHQNPDHSSFFKQLLQKDIILHIFGLLKDMLLILKPQVLKLTGKIGFSEPHHTAWIEAFLSVLASTKANYHLDIETVWDDEYYQIKLIVKGQLVILVILARVLKFVISKNTWKIWRIYKSENKQRKILQHEA